MAAARMENRAPLRNLQEAQKNIKQRETILQVEKRVKKSTPSNIDEVLLLNTVMNATRNRMRSNNSDMTKKLLKPPTYKIYNSRRFGSSASSSSGSLFRRRNSGRKSDAKHVASVHAFKQLKKSFTMIHGPRKKTSNLLQPKLLESVVRTPGNQHVRLPRPAPTKPMQVMSNIQNDLMAIDNLIKNRLHNDSAAKVGKPLSHSHVWDYPPTPQLSQCRNEQLVARTILQQQCKHLQLLMRKQSSKEMVPKPLPAPTKETPRRQRYSNPVVIKRDAVRPSTISINERRVYANRKPLSELQRPQVPKFSYYSEKPQIVPTSLVIENDLARPGLVRLPRPYEINGRIASSGTETLAHSAMLNTRGFKRSTCANIS